MKKKRTEQMPDMNELFKHFTEGLNNPSNINSTQKTNNASNSKTVSKKKKNKIVQLDNKKINNASNATKATAQKSRIKVIK